MAIWSSILRSTQPGSQDSHGPGRQRLSYLDGWRAIAIAGVFIDHFGTSRVFNLGRLGVELFFVLSGRLMGHILFVEKMPLGAFYYRRFSRVWPALAIFLAVLGGAGFFLPLVRMKAAYFLVCLTYTYNYAAALGHEALPVDHIWSLCIEEHTYLFLGLLALLARRSPRLLWPVLLGSIAFNVVDGAYSTIVLHQSYYATYWRTDVRMASITMGTAAYLASRSGRLRFAGAWPLGLILTGFALNVDAVPDYWKYTLGTAYLALGISTIEGDTLGFREVLSAPILVWIGLVSYSLYLWQQPFSEVRPHSLLLRLLPPVGAALAGIISFYAVENPTRRWLNGHAPKWTGRRERRVS
jgi:peptidoglycan/LPS O-acetylase OafA/YrhL